MNWFGNGGSSGEALKRRVEGDIDAFLRKVCGPRDARERIDPYGRRLFARGSARGMAWAQMDDSGQVFFHCAAYIMELPADRPLVLPLYRELLEMNWLIPGVQRFALVQDAVWVVFSEQAELVDREGIGRAIDRVMAFADATDNYLVDKYGGTSVARASRQPAAR